jgi:hypothetical protein
MCPDRAATDHEKAKDMGTIEARIYHSVIRAAGRCRTPPDFNSTEELSEKAFKGKAVSHRAE